MDIDPNTLAAIRIVRGQVAFDRFSEAAPEGLKAEAQAFVGAAQHLADDIQRLHAIIPSTSTPFETLDKAHKIASGLAEGIDPVTATPMPDWPHAPASDTADLVTMTLVLRVLPTVIAHAEHLAGVLRMSGHPDNVTHLVTETYRRVLDRPYGGSTQHRAQWAGRLHLAVGSLVRALNLARLNDTEVTARQFRTAVLGTGQMGLRQAVTVLHVLASKRLPDGRAIEWWPLRIDESHAVHVGQVLDRVLAVLHQHADALTAHGARILGGFNLHEFLAQMTGRVGGLQVDATVTAADFVQSGVHVLIGALPDPDSAVLDELAVSQNA